jgi:hypothetical protein
LKTPPLPEFHSKFEGPKTRYLLSSTFVGFIKFEKFLLCKVRNSFEALPGYIWGPTSSLSLSAGPGRVEKAVLHPHIFIYM